MTATIERHAPVIVDVVLHDAKTGKAETLTCTPEHPLFVAGQGWVEAGSVGIGTSIVSRAGPAMQVTGLTWQKNKAQELASGTGSSFGGYTVYNLTVEGDHTFFVGTTGGGTWVHNSCPTLHVQGPSRPKLPDYTNNGVTGPPDSIYEQTAEDGHRSVSYYDKGRRFSREDYDQQSDHYPIPSGAPHEHQWWFGLKGPIGKGVRQLSPTGVPVGPWF